MADRTQSADKLTREELSTYLKGLAEEIERGEEQISIPVGNKSVTLSPPNQVNCDVEVVERSSVLRGNREIVDIELSWKP